MSPVQFIVDVGPKVLLQQAAVSQRHLEKHVEWTLLVLTVK